jgi:hypothetical protein
VAEESSSGEDMPESCEGLRGGRLTDIGNEEDEV